MKTTFVCQIVPQEYVAKNKFVSQAANTFCFNFINILNPVKVFSFIPVFIEERISPFSDLRISAFQSRIFPHKFLGRYLNVLIDNANVIWKLWKMRSDSEFWFYNLLSYHYVLAYVVLKFVFRQKCYFIIADYNPKQGSFLKFLVDRSDGVISFSSGYFHSSANKNKRIFPGLIKRTETDGVKIKALPAIKNVLFSGRLERYTGIDLALEVFSKCEDYNLIVSGEGTLKELVVEYSRRFNNIRYVGFLPYDEYIGILEGVGICLSFRNPGFIENQFNFPSKILEYMGEGKIVLSTMEYDVIEQHVIVYCKFDILSVLDALRRIERMTEDERNELSGRIRHTVMTQFSQEAMATVVQEVMEAGR
jgi:glycosyltransferase involved in cell wall biosynthesis